MIPYRWAAFDVPSTAFGLLLAAVIQLFAAMFANNWRFAVLGLVCALLSAITFAIHHQVLHEQATQAAKEVNR